MATTMLTLGDVAQREAPDGSIDVKLAEILLQTNDILFDIPWMECNEGNTHRLTLRSSIPVPGWRSINAGATKVKTQTTQLHEDTGLLEDESIVDARIIDNKKKGKDIRWSEDKGIVQGFGFEVSRSLFYASGTTEEEFFGLSPRFPAFTTALSVTQPHPFRQVISAGGTTDGAMASIWLIGWGEEGCFGIYPEGELSGLQMEDLKKDVYQDGSGNEFRVYRTFFDWTFGIAVKNYRTMFRICNIDVAAIIADPGSASIDLLSLLMISAANRIQKAGGLTYRWYMNPFVAEALEQQNLLQTNVRYGVDGVQGEPEQSFRNIPIRRVDQLLITESLVPESTSV